MRKVLLALSASLLAYPAAAQTEGTTDAEEPTTAEQPAATETATGSALGCAPSDEAAAAGTGTSAVTAGSEEELRSALSEAGFEDVQVLRAAYVMQAVAPNNECMAIIIDAGAASPEMATGTATGEVSASTEAEPATGATSGEVSAEQTGEESTAGEATAETEASEATEGAAAVEETSDPASQAAMSAEGATATLGQSSQQITGDLLDSGYKDVTVLEAAYVVVGRAPDGSMVTMLVRSGEAVE